MTPNCAVLQAATNNSAKASSSKCSRTWSGPDTAQTGQRLDQLAKTIAKLVDSELVKIDVSEAIVADVTPSQLRAIAGLDDVAAIRPNRTHQVVESIVACFFNRNS